MQHDCPNSNCGLKPRRVAQERELSGRNHNVFVHSDNNNFVLNTHSLHNYKIIKTFIATLHAPVPPVLAEGKAEEFRRAAAVSAQNKRIQKQLAKDAAACEQVMGRAKAPDVPSGSGDDSDGSPSDAEYEPSGSRSGASAPPPSLSRGVGPAVPDETAIASSSTSSYGVFDIPIGSTTDPSGSPHVWQKRKRTRSKRGAQMDALSDGEDDAVPPSLPSVRRRVTQTSDAEASDFDGGEDPEDDSASELRDVGRGHGRGRGRGRGQGRGRGRRGKAQV